MSVVYIINHTENIYDLTNGSIQKSNETAQKTAQKKIPSYISKHRERIKATTKIYCKEHATMGVARIQPPTPRNYLRKHTGKIAYSQVNDRRFEKTPTFKKRSNLPTRAEIDELNRKRDECRSKPNHIVENIKYAKTMKAKVPQHCTVIDQFGTKRRDGETIYIKSKLFGKTPKYLRKLLAEQKRTCEKEKDLGDTRATTKCKQITPEERQQLLQGLKHNWTELQKEFQTLPILTDTIPKVNRKVKLENDLKQLEKDIDLIENHPCIFIYD